jgi:hypothetical protein
MNLEGMGRREQVARLDERGSDREDRSADLPEASRRPRLISRDRPGTAERTADNWPAATAVSGGAYCHSADVARREVFAARGDLQSTWERVVCGVASSRETRSEHRAVAAEPLVAMVPWAGYWSCRPQRASETTGSSALISSRIRPWSGRHQGVALAPAVRSGERQAPDR